MMHLITGGSGSGKSAYAEQWILEAAQRNRLCREGEKGTLIYLATMRTAGAESRKRILRHQRMRAGKHFQTIECPERLDQISWEPHSYVLLEDLSNLVANVCFQEGGRNFFRERNEILEQVVSEVLSVEQHSDTLVVVTNQIYSDGVHYGEETDHYMQILAQANERLARQAEQITEVVYGIPLAVRREEG